MKRLFISLTLVGATINLSAQCSPNLPCSNPITTAYIQNTSYNGDQCFQGSTIANSVNWNNWMSMTFMNGATSYQVLNVPVSGNIYSDGSNTLYSVNLQGSGHVTVSGQQLNILSLNSNNSNIGQENKITLVNGAQVFYNGTQYYAGQYIQLQGNSSNRVYIEACNSVPLPITVVEFRRLKDDIYWKVELTGGDKVELQHALLSNSSDFTSVYSSSQSEGKWPASAGFYRLKVDGEFSNIIFVPGRPEDYTSSRIVDLGTGRVVSQPSKYRPFIQDGKVKCIVD